MKHDPKKLTPSEAELAAAFNAGDFFAFGSGKSHNEVILERRNAELKERLAAAEHIMIHSRPNFVSALTKLYTGTELDLLELQRLRSHPPTDPYLARLWEKYQKLQRFQ